MTATTLPRGSFILVFPEDVDGAIEHPSYARIKSSRGITVSVIINSEAGAPDKTLKISRATALTRKVSSCDAEGARLGTWIRQAVCVLKDGQYAYGQVTGYPDTCLLISTLSGHIEAARDDIRDTVYTVVAMIMGCHQFSESEWSYEQFHRIHDALMDRLLVPQSSAAPCEPLSIAQLMQGLLPEVSPGFDRLCSWIDAGTGKCTRLSIQHVVNYVFYVDGGKIPLANMEGMFGTSFCDNQSGITVRTERRARDSPQEPQNPPTDSASTFFDVLEVDDANEPAADEALLARTILPETGEAHRTELPHPINPMQHSHRFEPPVRYTQPPAPTPSLSTTARTRSQQPGVAKEEDEILELIRAHKPHLLSYHLATSGTSLKRMTPPEDDGHVTKRGKFSFTPTPEQLRVHGAVTSASQRGKSPTEFVESLVSSSELWAYPGVAIRAYDIEFGSRGLSFLHFSPVEEILRLRRQRESFINMSDFSVSAKFMPAPDLTSWEEILAGANGFHRYCITRCDSVTQHLALTLYSFIVELKGRNLWPKNMLLTLVLWIDAQLERYRAAAVADVVSGFGPGHKARPPGNGCCT